MNSHNLSLLAAIKRIVPVATWRRSGGSYGSSVAVHDGVQGINKLPGAAMSITIWSGSGTVFWW